MMQNRPDSAHVAVPVEVRTSPRGRRPSKEVITSFADSNGHGGGKNLKAKTSLGDGLRWERSSGHFNPSHQPWDAAQVKTVFRALDTPDNSPHKTRTRHAMNVVGLTDEEAGANDSFCPGRENTSTSIGRESTMCTTTSETSMLSEMTALADEMRSQIAKLTGELSEQKDKLSSLQEEVSGIVLTTAVRHAVAMVEPAAEELSSPKKRGRLSFPNLRSCISRSRSQSRSVSPKKNIHVEISDETTHDIDALALCPALKSMIKHTHSPVRCESPEKGHSPSRRIEQRIAPRLLSNITNFVDSQIQNLEERMANMETSMDHWRQAALPDGAVDGMCSADLQRLSGLTVVESHGADDFHRLLDPTSDAAWDHRRCSVAAEGGNSLAEAGGAGKPSSKRLEQSKSHKRSDLEDKDKSYSWKRFSIFRRSKAKQQAKEKQSIEASIKLQSSYCLS